MILLKILKKERTGQITLPSDLQQTERKRMNQVTLSLCFSKIWFNNFVFILDNYTENEKEDNDDNETSSNGSEKRKSDLF